MTLAPLVIFGVILLAGVFGGILDLASVLREIRDELRKEKP